MRRQRTENHRTPRNYVDAWARLPQFSGGMRGFFHLLIFLCALAAQAVIAASSQFQTNYASQHVFMVSPDGACLNPVYKWYGQSRKKYLFADEALDGIRSGIASWTNSAWAICRTNADLPPRVVIFVHGGMNPYSSSKARVEDTNLISALAASNCYPILVVWDSGLPGAYMEHLFSVRQGEQHHVLGAVTSPVILASDLAVGLVRLPTTLTGRYYNDWRTSEFPNGKAVTHWEKFESLVSSNLPSFHPPQKEANTRTWTERSVRFTEYVVTTPTKVATLPLIDGLGTESWEMMRRRTRTMFKPPAIYEISDHPPQKQKQVANWLNRTTHAGVTNAGAMCFFGDTLAEWSNETFTNLNFEFYGHSMGTIVLNELFRYQPDIKASRVAYLGAACSIDDFESALFPYLQTHTNTEFFSLSLHRMREREEYGLFSAGLRFIFLRDLIVRGSLLNWVDDIFARPDTITERTLGAWENTARALPDIPADLRDRTHLRGCDMEKLQILQSVGGEREPQVHGDFTRSVFWSTNFLWPATTNSLRLRPE